MSNCDGNCNYKRLYEGSQASLNDMAAKQASALRRVAALREGVLSSLKQHFPAEYAQAEVQLGKRVTLAGDEIVLAYLTGFLALPPKVTAAKPASSAPADPDGALDPLRAQLEGLGIRLPQTPGSDGWVDAIRVWAATRERSPEGTYRAPAPAVEDRAYSRGPEHGYQEPPIVVTADLLADLFGEEAPVEPEDDWAGEDGLELLFLDNADPYEALLGESAVLGADPQQNDNPDAHTDTDSASYTAEVQHSATELTDLFSDGNDVPATLLVEALDVIDGETVTDERVTGPGVGATSSPAVNSTPRTTQPGQQLGLPGGEGSVRPEIIAQPQRPVSQRKGRVRKETRVSATPPGEVASQGASGPPSSLAVADTASTLLRQAKPLFTSDLIAAGHTPDEIAAWEEDCRSLGRDAPVRFLVPKARHRDRGNLVLPSEEVAEAGSDAWKSSPWGQCVHDRRLRAARLYELAVLFRRNDTKVKTVDVEDHVVALRLSAQRGMVGVLFVAESELAPGSAAREQASEMLARMLDERGTLLVVATSHTSEAAPSRLADTLREISDEKGWKVSVPVVAAQSWVLDVDGSTTMVEALP